MTETEPVRKTSFEWQSEVDYDVLDPDGWDRRNFQFSFFEEEITREEFDKRLWGSTVAYRGPRTEGRHEA